jgi:hypothetical protein
MEAFHEDSLLYILLRGVNALLSSFRIIMMENTMVEEFNKTLVVIKTASVPLPVFITDFPIIAFG